MSKIDTLFDFINSSPTSYHAVSSIADRLTSCGYTEICEKDTAAFSDGGKHFVRRNGSSIIAFSGRAEQSFIVTAAHSDFPSFKVKSCQGGAYARVTTERYGSMILYSWLDRPLSIAGRAVVRRGEALEIVPVNFDRDMLVIPSVAIHQNRTVNEGYALNPAVDMLPLYTAGQERFDITELLAAELSVDAADIVSHDLFVYNRECARLLDGGLILSPRLDDLECVSACLDAFLEATPADGAVNVLAVFDNEEVGSSTKQGANSSFLDMTLRRIAGSDERYYSMLPDSFMVSADNAHAKHPNHPELSDSVNAPILGEGVAVKYNANQSYATDAVSDAIFRTAASRAGAKVQSFSTRADKPSGSTLGSIANTKVSISTVDVGLPQLAMHSSTETAATADYLGFVDIVKELYSSRICRTESSIEIIK